jgi:crotonobetainyl-CoA:carnitine CoA-transferase CaiB-like acyl-CoA transferase
MTGTVQSATPAAPDGPLAGIRVLELANHLAAPSASMYLADFGAEVIKIERPGEGDELRRWGHRKDGVGLYFKVINRGKRSVTADLRTPLGAEIVKRLVVDADVVVENYRPGTLARWGLDYDVLSGINPRVVMLKVSGFGQTGPYRERPGFGTLAEAFSGCAHITGHADGPPLLPAFGLGDASTGLMSAFLTLVALRERDRSGRGQVVDLGLYEALFTLLGPQVVNLDQLGIVQQRDGSRLPFVAPRNTFRTRDGRWVAIAGATQATFERMCTALDVEALARDPRFVDNANRIRNAPALDAVLQAVIDGIDYDDLMTRFGQADAAAAPVNDVAMTMADPQVVARENVATVHDEELGGPVRMQNVVGRLSRTPGRIRRAGPRLGEHNREILVGRLGLSEALLREAGIDIDGGATTC